MKSYTMRSMKGSTRLEAWLNTLPNQAGKSDSRVSWITSNMRPLPLQRRGDKIKKRTTLVSIVSISILCCILVFVCVCYHLGT